MNNYANNDVKDEVLRELWEAKDYYSLSCNSDFRALAKKVKEDIKNLDAINNNEDIQKVSAS